MKIYLDINIEKIKNITNLVCKTKNYKKIYSNTGIYIIENDKLYKQIPIDSKIETININRVNYTIDKSIFRYKDSFHIPLNSIIINIKEYQYIINNKTDIILIIQYNNEKFYDFYFETSIKNNINLIENFI